MEQREPIINTGLRGVTIASTRISDVDGNAGKLIYRGYLAPDLAKSATFEEICHLLLYEKLPDAVCNRDHRVVGISTGGERIWCRLGDPVDTGHGQTSPRRHVAND